MAFSLDLFRQSNWFTRGWTLQELLAPKRVLFWDQVWRYVGEKSELKDIISKVTGITAEKLEYPTTVFSASVATRMSWASKRHTSRLEDMAYCLLGIFGINMPLLYGEQKKAFTRLQHEIIKQSDDGSIFFWTDQNVTSMLAPWPSVFLDSEIKYDAGPFRFISDHRPYYMTNRGLQIYVPRETPVILRQTLDIPMKGDAVTHRKNREDFWIEPEKLGQGDSILLYLKCHKIIVGPLPISNVEGFVRLQVGGWYWARKETMFLDKWSNYPKLAGDMTIYIK